MQLKFRQNRTNYTYNLSEFAGTILGGGTSFEVKYMPEQGRIVYRASKLPYKMRGQWYPYHEAITLEGFPTIHARLLENELERHKACSINYRINARYVAKHKAQVMMPHSAGFVQVNDEDWLLYGDDLTTMPLLSGPGVLTFSVVRLQSHPSSYNVVLWSVKL